MIYKKCFICCLARFKHSVNHSYFFVLMFTYQAAFQPCIEDVNFNFGSAPNCSLGLGQWPRFFISQLIYLTRPRHWQGSWINEFPHFLARVLGTEKWLFPSFVFLPLSSSIPLFWGLCVRACVCMCVRACVCVFRSILFISYSCLSAGKKFWPSLQTAGGNLLIQFPSSFQHPLLMCIWWWRMGNHTKMW